jgi:hypothetical protein
VGNHSLTLSLPYFLFNLTTIKPWFDFGSINTSVSHFLRLTAATIYGHLGRMKTSRKISLIIVIVAMAILACLVVLVLRSRPDEQAEPVATSLSGTSGSPAFAVRVIMPRMGLPLGGILPDWVTRKFDGTPSELRFGNASPGAEILSVGPDRVELKADGWDLTIASDGAGRITPGSRLVVEMGLGGRQVKLNCRPAEPAIGQFQTTNSAGSEEFVGSFIVEFANCENAVSRKAIEWPPAPMTVRGIFRGSAKPPSPAPNNPIPSSSLPN